MGRYRKCVLKTESITPITVGQYKKYIKCAGCRERARITHHTTGGVHLSVRYAAEVATATAIVL